MLKAELERCGLAMERVSGKEEIYTIHTHNFQPYEFLWNHRFLGGQHQRELRENK